MEKNKKKDDLNEEAWAVMASVCVRVECSLIQDLRFQDST